MQLKKTKSHTSTRKKASSSKSTPRTKQVASKALKGGAKSKAAKEKEERARLRREKKLHELTLKVFSQVYDDYQQGKFHRIF